MIPVILTFHEVLFAEFAYQNPREINKLSYRQNKFRNLLWNPPFDRKWCEKSKKPLAWYFGNSWRSVAKHGTINPGDKEQLTANLVHLWCHHRSPDASPNEHLRLYYKCLWIDSNLSGCRPMHITEASSIEYLWFLRTLSPHSLLNIWMHGYSAPRH